LFSLFTILYPNPNRHQSEYFKINEYSLSLSFYPSNTNVYVNKEIKKENKANIHNNNKQKKIASP